MLLSLVFLPMLLAVCSCAAGKLSPRLRQLCGVFAAAAEFVLALICLFQPPSVLQLGSFCGLGLRLTLDGFRKIYLLVISFLWLMTFLLSGEYFSRSLHLNRYYFFNLLTLGATVGVFLAADLFTAFVFFEVMSFTSYAWVAHSQTPDALRAANTYLTVAVLGGLVALMGLFLLQWKLGTTELSRLRELAAGCGDKAMLYAAGGCILFGFGAKAGMFPLHIWLPKAHPVAPAPASALLSGLLTKTGVWGVLAISCNLFFADACWGGVVLGLGTATMLLGALLALFSIDLKRTLACSSMSQIGFILVGVGMLCLSGEENGLAARGVLLHMMNHSLFKLVLFGCASVIYMNAHSLDLNRLRGWGRGKPLLCMAFLLGALGICGIPGCSGYISKTLLHESIAEGVVSYGWTLTLVEWVFLISGGLTLAYMTKLFVAIFVEKPSEPIMSPDSGKRYWNAASAVSVLLPALLIPSLGLTAPWTMDRIAALGVDFFRAESPFHSVAYFSLESLKGAIISTVIGAAVYLLVVRRWILKNGVYRDLWPKKLDLDERVYRPLLFAFLPLWLGKLAAVFGENRLSGRSLSRLSRAAGTLSENLANMNLPGKKK